MTGTSKQELLAVTASNVSLLALANFAEAWQMARQLAGSDLLPSQYRDKPANVLLALDIAERMRMSIVQVVQNLTVIDGKPTWASQFVIAAINASGRFAPLRFETEDRGPCTVRYTEFEWSDREKRKIPRERSIDLASDLAMRAYTTDRHGVRLNGSWVSYKMAVQEGWFTRRGSKWLTMGEQMLTYRAAAFFGRIYAPELTNGMLSVDEAQDVSAAAVEGTFREVEGPSDLALTIESAMAKQAAMKRPATPASAPEDAMRGPKRSSVVEADSATASTPAPAEPTPDEPTPAEPSAEAPQQQEAGTEAERLIESIATFMATAEDGRPELEQALIEPIESVLADVQDPETAQRVMSAVHQALNAFQSRRDAARVQAAYKEAYTRLFAKR